MRSSAVKSTWIVLVLAGVGLSIHASRTWSAERAWERRLVELRACTEPALGRRAMRTREVNELWSELEALDARIEELAPWRDAPLIALWRDAPEIGEIPGREQIEEDLARMAAWVAPAEDVLDQWMALAASERFTAALAGGERLPDRMPRLCTQRNWVNLLAWRAYLEANDPARRERAALTLASLFDVGEAFDDRSLLAEMIRAAVESWALRDMGTLFEWDQLDPVLARAAFDPRLARSAALDRRTEAVENELLSFVESVDGLGFIERRAGIAEMFDGPQQYHDALEYFASVEDAFLLAHLPPSADLAKLFAPQRDAPFGFKGACRSAFAAIQRGRSVSALARVRLAILEYRARSGSFPASLDDLAPLFPAGMPVDPLTDKPFVYELGADGARLGPAACAAYDAPEWDAAVERLLAFEF